MPARPEKMALIPQINHLIHKKKTCVPASIAGAAVQSAAALAPQPATMVGY
jgi:hypothetical protein